MNKSNTQKEDKDLWATPWWVFHFAEHYFGFKFDLDTCALPHNAKVGNFITPAQNTLITDWHGQHCWMNPPYSNPLPFVKRAIEQAKDGRKVVLLLNVDNSTQWFALCAEHATEMIFITHKRIAFINNQTGKETKGNNKGQMLVLFDQQRQFTGVCRTNYISLLKMKTIGEQRMAERTKGE